ncbi:MAG: transposase [Candidatus Marinimicrobia bacterium]|nr:transposase [Candidatus Neomarinimicrobiota bacterium]
MNNEHRLTICGFRSEYLLHHSKLLVPCSDIDSSRLDHPADRLNRHQPEGLKEQSSIGAKHLGKLFPRVKHKISNNLSEEFNSRIQQIKMVARGLRSFRNYRVLSFFISKLWI